MGMVLENVVWVFSLWFASLIVGWASWPFSQIFFHSFSDRGYSVSKIIGMVWVTYFLFLLATLKLLPLSLRSILLILAVWAVINGVIEFKYRLVRSRIKVVQIVCIEFFFLALMSVMAFIKGHQPELYQIERFMDVGFIQALFNARFLPLFDIWMSGTSVNYYYFGHVLAYVIISLSAVPVMAGFYGVTAWIFGVVGINCFRCGHDLFVVGQNRGLKVSSGVLSFFNVLVAGVPYSVYWLFLYARFFLRGQVPSFFYPEPTRVIPGTITEIPIYSFIVAELHAHVWGLVSGILVLCVLWAWWGDTGVRVVANKYSVLLAFLLGVVFMINSWDAVTLGVFSLAVMWVKFLRGDKKSVVLASLVIPLGAYAVALPWSLFFQAPLSGVGIVKNGSPLVMWWAFWGFLMVFVVLLLVRLVLMRMQKKSFSFEPYYFWLLVVCVALFFLGFLEAIYFKDILKDGEWFRANTVFKIAMQVWLWLGVISGPVLVWLWCSCKKRVRIIFTIFIVLIVAVQSVYPVVAVWQSHLNKSFTGLDSGLVWWKNKYPYDFEAYEFLVKARDSLPEGDKVRTIVEAEGDSYTDVSRFSVFLGWPTIIGWPVHEWTWRGSYEEVGRRRADVVEAYTGKNSTRAKEILNKYGVDYVVIGQVEKAQYREKLQVNVLKKVGRVVFMNNQTMIVEVSANRKLFK